MYFIDVIFIYVGTKRQRRGNVPVHGLQRPRHAIQLRST
jgi:hypothetical protein